MARKKTASIPPTEPAWQDPRWTDFAAKPGSSICTRGFIGVSVVRPTLILAYRKPAST